MTGLKNFKILLQKLIFSIVIAFTGLTGYSRHIIGSDFYYDCNGPGRGSNTKNFSFNLTIYRDCSNPAGSPYDPDASFGIYRFNGTRYTYITQFSVNHGQISRVLPENNPCLIIPPNVCVEEASYRFAVDLPLTSETYVIYYMRCCRNNTILNINAPNNTGATFYIEISPEAQQACNSSPRFKAFPPIVICADFPLDFDHSATDKDGDSLVYEFCTPLAGGGSGAGDPFGGGQGCGAVRPNPAICAPPFSYVSFVSPLFTTQDPMGPGVLKLDPVSGKLVGKPVNLGQYVVGICVNEYRAGVLIGTIHRDFQFNVGTCEQAVHAKIQSDTSVGKNFSINYCGDNTVKLTNQSFRDEYIKNYYWEFRSGASSQTYTSNDKNATITFPAPGKYKGLMIVNRNALICSDTAFVDLNIIPSDIKAGFEFDYDKCSSLPIKFMDQSSGSLTPPRTWHWDFNDGTSSRNKNSSHLFQLPGKYQVTLTVTDGSICKSTASREIAYFPAPQLLDVLPDKFRGCAPATIRFQNLSIPLDSTYQVDWEFGDGTRASGLHATHTYNSPGVYSISMSILAPSGCVTRESFNSFVRVQEGPVSAFDFSPKSLTTLNPSVQFTNMSRDAVAYSWNFGDENGSELENPSHLYQDTGTYIVNLIAKHQNGCIDTSQKQLDVLLNISYFLPNAFTPNNDGVNDFFLGAGSMTGMQDFNMSIFNRWGEMVFYTEDPLQGWNGRKNNQGLVEPNGVYVCLVRYKTDRGEGRELKGFATLIR